MKRNLLMKVGILILASSMFVLSCQQEPVEYSGSTDTVNALGTPNVRGIAYPGVNYIYWDKVANADNGYLVSVYENGTLKNVAETTVGKNTTYYVDTDVHYDVEIFFCNYRRKINCSIQHSKNN